jgi:hypothetical protein
MPITSINAAGLEDLLEAWLADSLLGAKPAVILDDKPTAVIGAKSAAVLGPKSAVVLGD